MEQNNKNGFSYTYSAREQEEIRRIRKKYVSNEAESKEDKMERLRRLDAGVTTKGTVFSLIVGIIGALILGTGMSFVMTDLGNVFESKMLAMVIGILMGFVGAVGVALAYPLYNFITRKERQRIAPEILRLTEELTK
ncbi:MAG: hypothetical protein J6B09_05015 [Clostridia bacterium]|nr:hypothetical protein [Clostridia bacterium]